MWPTCKGNPADHGEALRLGKFPDFDYDSGTGPKIRVTSLEQVRKIERESMAAYKNGVPGAAPVAFRAFALNNDGKHYDNPVFGPNPDKRPERTRNRDGTPFFHEMPTPSKREYDVDD
jgi:hypothetical protein